MFTWQELVETVNEIKYKDWILYTYYVNDRIALIQWVFVEDGKEQKCRQWVVDYSQPLSDVVRTAWLGVHVAEEHEARERFRYKGKRVFGPHFDVNKLTEISGQLEYLEIPPDPVIV